MAWRPIAEEGEVVQWFSTSSEGTSTTSTTDTLNTYTCDCCRRRTWYTITWRKPERPVRPEFASPKLDGRWRQHDMAWYAFRWPAPLAEPDQLAINCRTPPVRRFGREGLGVRNWCRR
jgi:hypothetical protein